MKRVILIIGIALILSLSVNAKTYYVDGQHGSDTNAGTQEDPFQTIGKAVSVLQQNDLVNWTNVEQIEYHEALGIIMKQDDRQTNMTKLDKGTWKERVNTIENSSIKANLSVKLTFQYEIEDSDKRKSMRCVGHCQ